MHDVECKLVDAISAKNKDFFIRTIGTLSDHNKSILVGHILRDTVETKSTEDLMFVLECVPYDQLLALMGETDLDEVLGTVLRTAAFYAFYATEPNSHDKKLDILLKYLKRKVHIYLRHFDFYLPILQHDSTRKGYSKDEAYKNAVNVCSLIFKYMSREETLSF